MKRYLARTPLGPEMVLEGLWLVAAVAVPLVMSPWGANSFELPKALLLRLLVLLMALAALWQALEDRKPAPKTGGGASSAERSKLRKLILWLTLLFGLVLVAATAFSVDARASLWGSYDRQQGLLTLGAYLALFALTASHLRSRAQVERLWLALVWGSAPVVAYGLLQGVGLDPLSWETDAASGVLSTLGRANFVGSYLVLVAPLTAMRLPQAAMRLPQAAMRLPQAAGQLVLSRRRWPYGLLLAGQVACLALTQARAAWLGMGAALVVGLLAWAATGGRRRWQVAALALAVLAGGFVAMLNQPGGALAPLADVPGLGRLAALGDGSSGSTAARLTTWRATLPLMGDRLALGYGPETMRQVFARVFPPELVYYQGRHVSVDRAHNLWLDVGISAGLAGVLALGGLLAGWGWLAWRGRPGSGDRWARVVWCGVVAAVAGHLVDLQFSFDLTGSGTVFWLVLALGVAANARTPMRESRGLPVGRPMPTATGLPAQGEARASRATGGLYLVLPAVLALVLAWLVCGRPFLADLAYAQARDAAYAQARDAISQPGARLAASQRAVRLWPLEPLYRLELAGALVENGQGAAAEGQVTAAVELSPEHPGLWAAIGGLYAGWGERAPEQFVQAEAAYRQALALAPNVATYHTALGLILARQGRPEEGLEELERAVALDATDFVAYGHLADLYQALGWEDKAAWALQQAERWERETMGR